MEGYAVHFALDAVRESVVEGYPYALFRAWVEIALGSGASVAQVNGAIAAGQRLREGAE